MWKKSVAGALLLTAVLAVVAASWSLAPVSAWIGGITATPTTITAKSGGLQDIPLSVSTTYSGCWGPCEAAWFYMSPQPANGIGSTMGVCSWANGNPVWWGGTCTVTIHVYVNYGLKTPPGTYYLTIIVRTYAPDIYATIVVLTVT